MLINFFLILIIVPNCLSTTSIKTYPTVNLTENVPINTNVIKLIPNKEEEEEIKKVKLVLLNLSGYETNLFKIENENIFTTNQIDREEFVKKKRCFDRFYCLIELHILVNDGEEYWVIPIHIIDENDNKPSFVSLSINITIEEKSLNKYKIPFDGGIDIDEGINNKIFYILDCSINKINQNKIIKEEKYLNNKLINCLPLFNLIIFSQSLINQNDQLAIEINSEDLIFNQYQLILYAFNFIHNEKQLINSMFIYIYIKQNLSQFILSKYQFILNDQFFIQMNSKQFIGKIPSKSNNFIYQIINSTNNNENIELNSITGDLILINNNKNISLKNEINLLIESSSLINENIKKLINIQILIRLLNKLNKISFNYQINSLFIQQINKTNSFIIKEDKILSNLILFNLTILSSDYPEDQFLLSLFNSHSSLFSLLSSNENNHFIFKTKNYFAFQSIYFLTIQIQHQLTKQYLTNLTLQFIPLTQSSSLSSSSPIILCRENSRYNLYDLNQTNLIGKVNVIETNINVSLFSRFLLSNENEMMINQCRMRIDQFHIHFNQSDYQLCSLSNQCYHISLENKSHPMFLLRRFLKIRPIEITILCISLVFILATISLILIICRLRGFHLCLSVKNYLFYGKKYGLNHNQRLSANKITERVQSIVVRESRSPSTEHIKSIEPYMFDINQYIEQDKIPSINLYHETTSHILTSLSCTSSLERGERTISNVDNEMIVQPSSVVQETKQLIEMLTTNEDLDISGLASEV